MVSVPARDGEVNRHGFLTIRCYRSHPGPYNPVRERGDSNSSRNADLEPVYSLRPRAHARRATIFRMVYLLTFGCYGHWLPGDERGSVDRTRGEHRGGPIVPSFALVGHSIHAMSTSCFTLTLHDAHLVLQAIQEVCTFRGYGLLAAHVRATHVHAVADLPGEPGDALRDFKAYASRALNRAHGTGTRWSRGGSTRRLPTPDAIRAAVRYVAENQGDEMALFVADNPPA